MGAKTKVTSSTSATATATVATPTVDTPKVDVQKVEKESEVKTLETLVQSEEATKITDAAFHAYWGLDSANPADYQISWNETQLEYGIRIWGRKPDFYGRYIGDLYQITPQEVSYLHSKGVSILIVYNGLTAWKVQQGYQTGVNEARRAITYAQSLNIPHSVCIYGDIERDWWPTRDFMGGWADTFRNSTYFGSGGFYGNPLDPGFTNSFNQAYNTYPSVQNMLIWSNQPEPGNTMPPPTWNPAYPDTNAKGTVIWQYRIDVNGFDLNECSQAGIDSMWRPIVVAMILHTCAFKPEHNHTSHSIKTLFGGSRITLTGKEAVQDNETWVEGHVGSLTGWVLKPNTHIVEE